MDTVKISDFDEEAEILKVLGHSVRLKIVVGLLSKECNVKQIWECLGLPQATVSQHLSLLKNKKIVEGKRDGIEVYYTVVHPMAKKIVNLLTGMNSDKDYDLLLSSFTDRSHSAEILSQPA